MRLFAPLVAQQAHALRLLFWKFATCRVEKPDNRLPSPTYSPAASVGSGRSNLRNYRVSNSVDSVSGSRTLKKSIFAIAMHTNTAPKVQTMVAPVGKSKYTEK